jgi:CBS domain-containing protein
MHIRDVMTPNPRFVSPDDSIQSAARIMRDEDTGAVPVCDNGRAVGIVTDRDIVVRAVADGKDPNRVTVGEIFSSHLTAVSPSDDVDHAVELMREQAVRRLPVVEDGRPVGIVSIGDLAIDRDRRSALAEISAAPPNT